MHQERRRALVMFLCSCAPMSIELVHSLGMSTIVDWRIVCLTFLYWRLSATASKYSSCPEAFAVLREASRAALSAVVVYAWLSFLTSMRPVAVECLLADVTRSTYKHTLFSLCRGGLSHACLNGVEELNKSLWMSRQCPSALIGIRLSSVYFFLVMVFRFIPCAFYGLWNLYTWHDDRFQADSRPSSLRKQRHVNERILLGSICILFSCVTVEIAMQGQILSLSSSYVILPYIAVLSIQYALKSRRFRESSREVLLLLQSQAITMSVFVSVLDLLIQILFVASVCLPDTVSISELTEACTTATDSQHITKCHEIIQSRTERTVFSDLCPSLTEKNNSLVGILYAANIIKVILLSLGTLILGKKKID